MREYWKTWRGRRGEGERRTARERKSRWAWVSGLDVEAGFEVASVPVLGVLGAVDGESFWELERVWR